MKIGDYMAKMNIKSYQKKDGKTYYTFSYRVGVCPDIGRELKTTRRGFKTKKEAANAYKALIAEIEINGYKQQKKETVEDLYNIWLPIYAKTVRESTLEKTKAIFKFHILPELGNHKLEKITVLHCQSAINRWFEKLKRHDKVVIYAKKIFNYGISIDLMEKNPMEYVTLPKRKFYEIEDFENFYTKEELTAFLGCLSNIKYQKKAFFHLLASTGMRRGEIVALTWKDIDLVSGMLLINKNLTHGRNGRLIINDPKTKNSKRIIKIDDTTLEIIKKWKKIQAKELSTSGLKTRNNQIIFHNGKNEYHQPTAPAKWLNSIIKRNGLSKISIHGFRHTHCSILHEAGLSLKQAQDRLGHTDIKTTLGIYTHLDQKKKNESIDVYSKFMNS